jgi:manganese/zinc/iron transport system permease protein
MNNPYSGETFFGFLIQLFWRLISFFQGNIDFNNIASDEIQIIVLCGIATSTALLGTFLVLRKMTMLANALSHTILLGVIIAYIFTIGQIADHDTSINIKALLFGSLITGLATTFLTEFLTKTAGLQEDASIGIVFSSLFAIGIILATLLTRNAHIGTEVVMGNVDALQLADCKLVLTILGINLICFILFFKEFKITTFDQNLAKSLGFSPIFFNYLLMLQVSATCIGSFRAVGVLMVLTFLTGPALTARFLTHNLKKMLLLAVSIGWIASIIGVAISRHLLSVQGIALSTGGVVVCTITAIFLTVLMFETIKSWVDRLRHANQNVAKNGSLPQKV